ncbi:MAG: tetratricopeptide repeat protein [Nitrospirota bacterium]
MTAPPSAWRSRGRIKTAVILISLAAAVAVAHGGAIHGQFHYDDQFVVVENTAVHRWQPASYFATPHAVNDGGQKAWVGGNRPLTVLSLALNYQVGGLDPRGYLLVNLVLHGLISWLIFLTGRELLGEARWAAVAAVVFALHPVNAEAVNYVTARSSLLATVFSLAAFWAMLRDSRRGKGVGWLMVGLAAFCGAMLSKESAVALVIPITAYWWLAPRFGDIGGRATTPIASRRAIRVVLASSLAALCYVVWWELMIAPGVSAGLPAARPVWTLLEIVGRSLALWLWPWPLGLEHPLTFLVRFDAWLAVWLVVCAVGLAGLGVLAVRRAPFVAWLLSWVIAGFAPLAPLPWLTTVALLQEHRLSMPAVALSWLTAAAIRSGWGWLAQVRPVGWMIRWALVGVGVIVAAGAISLDRARSGVWNDDRRLWEEAVSRSPYNPLARMNLGAAYMESGEFDRAEAEFRAIAAIDPTYSRAYYNLGLLALKRHQHGIEVGTDARPRLIEAAAAFRQAVAVSPEQANAHAALGRVEILLGDVASGERSLRAALALNPNHRSALNDLASVYMIRRDWSRALEVLTLLRQQDDSLDAAYLRGVALVGLGRRPEGEAVLRNVLTRLASDSRSELYRNGINRLLLGGEP